MSPSDAAQRFYFIRCGNRYIETHYMDSGDPCPGAWFVWETSSFRSATLVEWKNENNIDRLRKKVSLLMWSDFLPRKLIMYPSFIKDVPYVDLFSAPLDVSDFGIDCVHQKTSRKPLPDCLFKKRGRYYYLLSDFEREDVRSGIYMIYRVTKYRRVSQRICDLPEPFYMKDKDRLELMLKKWLNKIKRKSRLIKNNPYRVADDCIQFLMREMNLC